MVGRRIAALTLVAACLGCIDPTAERTRRDFEECGRATLGDVEVRIDPGIVAPWSEAPSGPAVRFRANAPVVELAFDSRAAKSTEVSIRIDNLPDGSLLPDGATELRRERKTLELVMPVPPGESRARIGPPEADVAAPFRFAWVGDVQGGFDRFERVRAAIDADPSIELVLFAGDLTTSGADADLARLVELADGLARPWYSVLGNHETTWGRGEAFQRLVGRLDFGFDYRGARFLLLDTASATLDEQAWDFARERLAGTAPKARIVGLHVPPLDTAGMRDAGFASRAEGGKLVELLSSSGVDLLLAGHLHTFLRTQVAGMQMVVSGNGGVGAEDRLDAVGLHYLAVSVDPARDSVGFEVVEVQ